LKAGTETLPDKLNREQLAESAEQELLAALEKAGERRRRCGGCATIARSCPALLGMDTAINNFFEKVMVNVEDEAVRRNRLRLLADVRALFLRGWDLSRVVVEGEKR
jgi:glycyl-tRNA synthetase beta chain